MSGLDIAKILALKICLLGLCFRMPFSLKSIQSLRICLNLHFTWLPSSPVIVLIQMLALPAEKNCLCFLVKFDLLSLELISSHYWLIIKKAHTQQGLNIFKLIVQSRGHKEKVQLWAATAEPASGLHDNHLLWITLEKEQTHGMQWASDTSICFCDCTVFIRVSICDMWQFFFYLA